MAHKNDIIEDVEEVHDKGMQGEHCTYHTQRQPATTSQQTALTRCCHGYGRSPQGGRTTSIFQGLLQAPRCDPKGILTKQTLHISKPRQSKAPRKRIHHKENQMDWSLNPWDKQNCCFIYPPVCHRSQASQSSRGLRMSDLPAQRLKRLLPSHNVAWTV